jgi:hypothetical protein
MNKFTNDESERKYQNVYKVGGKMPIKKVVKKRNQQQKKSLTLVAIAKKRNYSPQKTAR